MSDSVPNVFDPEPEPAAVDVMAKGFLAEVNQQASTMVQSAIDSVQRFWFRNQVDGEGVAYKPDGATEPTGPEILTAMGTNAQKFLAVSAERVKMIAAVSTLLGVELMDLTKASSPYDLTFNGDGSLDTATIKAEFAEPEEDTEE